MTYEELLTVSDGLGLNTKENDLQAFDGRIKGNRIAIRRSIPTSAEKACVLAEELGHYFTSTGDIMDDSVESQKQELKARQWAYDVQIGLSGLVEAKEAGCRNQFETAEYLGCRGKDVSVIEMTETVGAGVYASVLLALMQSLQKNHVSVMKKHRLLRIEKAQAVIMDPEGKEVSYPCDTVVLALGLRPDRSKLDEFRSAFPEAVVIGDAVAGRRIMEATKEGFGCAYSFRPLS